MENSVRCVVGFCMNGLVSGVFWGVVGGTMSAIAQLIKFGMVLLLTYMIAMGIFYLWEHNIANMSPSQMLAQPRRMSKQTSISPSMHREGSILKYPFVVEIPSKVSLDSVTKKKAVKGKEKRSIAESSRITVSKEEVPEEVLEKTDFVLQRNLEEEEPDNIPGVSGVADSGSKS